MILLHIHCRELKILSRLVKRRTVKPLTDSDWSALHRMAVWMEIALSRTLSFAFLPITLADAAVLSRYLAAATRNGKGYFQHSHEFNALSGNLTYAIKTLEKEAA